MLLCLLMYVISDVFSYFPNMVELTVGSFQLWRLVTSFMLPSIGQMAIINVLFQIWILYQFMPDIVSNTLIRKKSILVPIWSSRFSCKYWHATLLWSLWDFLFFILELVVVLVIWAMVCIPSFLPWYGGKLHKVLLKELDFVAFLVLYLWSSFLFAFWPLWPSLGTLLCLLLYTVDLVTINIWSERSLS